MVVGHAVRRRGGGCAELAVSALARARERRQLAVAGGKAREPTCTAPAPPPRTPPAPPPSPRLAGALRLRKAVSAPRRQKALGGFHPSLPADDSFPSLLPARRQNAACSTLRVAC